MKPSLYHHKQTSLFCLFPLGVALTFLGIGWLLAEAGEWKTAWFFGGAGLVQIAVGLSFQQLVIRDEGSELSVRFGPLPIFRLRVPYQEIRQVALERFPFLSGPGGKTFAWKFWRRERVIWSLWGNSCVVLQRPQGQLWLGTDDAVNLTRFLEEKVTKENS